MLISNYLQMELLQGWLDGKEVDQLEAEFNDMRQGILAVPLLISGLAMAIFFISWFRRAYFNLHQKFDHMNHSEGWAAGGWFVPFINLYRPFQIAKELFEESSFYLKSRGILVSGDVSSLLIPWWIFHLISNFLGRIIFRSEAESIEEFLEVTQLSIAAGFIDLIFYSLTFWVLLTYSEREKLMAEVEEKEQVLGQAIIVSSESETSGTALT